MLISNLEGGGDFDPPDEFPASLPPPLRDKLPLVAAQMMGGTRGSCSSTRPDGPGMDASVEPLAAVVRVRGLGVPTLL